MYSIREITCLRDVCERDFSSSRAYNFHPSLTLLGNIPQAESTDAHELRFYHDDAKPTRKTLPAHHSGICARLDISQNNCPLDEPRTNNNTDRRFHGVPASHSLTKTSTYFTQLSALGGFYGVATFICVDFGGFSPSFS